MPYKFSEQQIEEYHAQGYTIFRRILPPSLIRDLRRVCEEGARIQRERTGVQSQRFQPISDYPIDQKPFEDYRNLPELRDAIARVLSPDHVYGHPDWMGVLIEPQELPWCMQWHRDADKILDEAEWDFYTGNYEYGNQVNCALYDDPSTWFVPGSHLRPDTDEERNAFEPFPPLRPDVEGLGYEERERICLDYCEQMPGAVCMYLSAGDFALYRPSGWHLGNYTPYRKRATLHDGVMTPLATKIWMRRLKQKDISLETVIRMHAEAGTKMDPCSKAVITAKTSGAGVA